MVSDEEILERAFLSALQKHFKKPGPWLPMQTIAAGSVYPDAKGIPQGQVWEVYVAMSNVDAISVSGHVLCGCGDFMDYWYPASGVPPAATVFTVAGAVYTATTLSGQSNSALPSGFILTDGQVLSSLNLYEFYVLARRRFDLET